MTATTASPELGNEITVASNNAHDSVAGALARLARWVGFRLSRQRLDPPFSRGLGDDFAPEIAEALTAAHRAPRDAM